MSNDLFRVKEVPRRRFRLKKGQRTQWIEEGFIAPQVNDAYVQQYGETDGFLGTVLTQRRFRFALAAIILLMGVILTRSAQLQIVQGAEYRSLADRNRLRTIHIRSDRGIIYDRFGLPLVRNIPEYAVTMQPQFLPDDEKEREAILYRLYTEFLLDYTEQSYEEFIQTVEEARKEPQLQSKDLVLAQSIKQNHAILMQIWAAEIPAVRVEQFSNREYLNEGPLFSDANDTTVYPPVKSLSHLLGYMSPLRDGEYQELRDEGYLFNDVIGRTGLEFTYEKELRGEFGSQSVEVNAQGKEHQVLSQYAAKDGNSIMTSIDIEFQRAIENIVQKHLDENEKEKASVVVMNPNNGEVLALVSLPTFDNNAFAGGIDSDTYQKLITNENRPLFHRAISGEYPPGSTFKPVVAAAALQEGIVTPNTTFLSTGGIRINLWFFPDWRAGGHGRTNIYHALADSVNTYFYMVGGGYNDFEGLGVERISDYAADFALSAPLHIDLPGEKPGFLPSKDWKEEVKQERWYIGDTYHLAIGQGDILVTPLQVASLYSAIANGGTVYQPHLVTAFADENGTVTEQIYPEIITEGIIDPRHLETIQTGLRRVVIRGSGKRLAGLPIDVSGKTGTAQWHSQKDPHAWFAGYAPSDHPQIAFSILVEEGVEGSGISTAIANEILQWWIEERSP